MDGIGHGAGAVVSELSIIDVLQHRVHEINRDNGWFEEGRSFGDEMALLHSEVSEALEAFRDGMMVTMYRYESKVGSGTLYAMQKERDGVIGKPVGVPSEIADLFIRILDVCERYGIDLVDETRTKLRYNATRGHRHGGKAI